jgi:hypothetical protein
VQLRIPSHMNKSVPLMSVPVAVGVQVVVLLAAATALGPVARPRGCLLEPRQY